MANDDLPVITASGVSVGGDALGHGTCRSRMNMSVPHLLSACLFSRTVSQLEAAHQGKAFAPFWQAILAHATASILLTVASLESYVNELFADMPGNFPGIPSPVLEKLCECHEQKSILDKFDLALLLRNAALVDRGSRPGQDVLLLIRLRNALVHFKPEWFDSQDNHAKLSTQLKGYFASGPFLGADEPLFPRGWATHGCTAWAIRSSVDFIDMIEREAGLPRHLDQCRSQLTP